MCVQALNDSYMEAMKNSNMTLVHEIWLQYECALFPFSGAPEFSRLRVHLSVAEVAIACLSPGTVNTEEAYGFPAALM